MNSITIEALSDFFKNKSKYFLSEQSGYIGIPDIDVEGEQGEYNEIFKFYKHPEFPKNIFFRETWVTDSYGYNESIQSFDLVEGKQKIITVYEPIK